MLHRIFWIQFKAAIFTSFPSYQRRLTVPILYMRSIKEEDERMHEQRAAGCGNNPFCTTIVIVLNWIEYNVAFFSNNDICTRNTPTFSLGASFNLICLFIVRLPIIRLNNILLRKCLSALRLFRIWIMQSAVKLDM